MIITAHCVFACQGGFILAIYLALQQKSLREPIAEAVLPSALLENDDSKHSYDTVSKIRANAARPRRSSLLRSSLVFSFNIFDGTNLGEDSPWLAYLDDDYEEPGLMDTVAEEEENIDHTDNGLTTSLLSDPDST